MTNLFPPSVEKIVTDYLERLETSLRGMPEPDRRELADEIRSHIFESYSHEPGDDEIGRILAVLRRLGEPAEVVSSRIPGAMVRVARERRAPLYILAGILIALFGMPLGLGAVGILAGLLAALVGLLIGYFAAAVSMVVGGFVSALVFFIFIASPDFYQHVCELVGQPLIEPWFLRIDSQLAGVIGLIGSLLLAGLGLLMLWSGKHVWRGMRLVAHLISARVKRIFARRNGHTAG